MARFVAALALIATCVSASPAAATPLSPFIDLQEPGLTLVEDGAGLEGEWPVDLTVDIGGTVRFALLYWAGSEPCTIPDEATACADPTEPFDDQQVTFAGTPITGTVIGTETWPTSPPEARLAIGYFADVTSLVSAAGTGVQTFSFGDGNGSADLDDRDGVALVVAYTDAADSDVYRVQVWDGLDFAWADSPTAGDSRVTAPVTFNHGSNTVARTAQLFIIGGNGAADRPDQVTVSNNPTLFNVFDSVPDGDQWNTDEYVIDVPAGVGTTTVEAQSTPAGENPDALLWEVAILRVSQVDLVEPSCSSVVTNPVPKMVTHTIQDTDSGLAEILVTVSQNADTVVPPFTVGTTEPVSSTSTKIDQSQPMSIEIRVTDLAGNVTFCGYADARIDVTKDTVPDAPQDFSFTGSGSIGAFSLDDDATVTLPATRSFIVELGSYTITEAVVPSYVTTVACTDPTTNTTVSDVTRTATISADSAETVECTFTNTLAVGDADLRVTKTTTATDVTLGQTFAYLLVVVNDGPGAATGVQVTDTLPPQLEFVSSDCGAGAVGQLVTWNVGTLAVDGSAQCNVTVRVIAPGEISNTAVVTADQPDPDLSDNSSTAGIAGVPPFVIPALDWRGVVLLAMLLGVAALRFLRA